MNVLSNWVLLPLWNTEKSCFFLLGEVNVACKIAFTICYWFRTSNFRKYCYRHLEIQKWNLLTFPLKCLSLMSWNHCQFLVRLFTECRVMSQETWHVNLIGKSLFLLAVLRHLNCYILFSGIVQVGFHISLKTNKLWEECCFSERQSRIQTHYLFSPQCSRRLGDVLWRTLFLAAMLT